MINNAPAKMSLLALAASYTKVYILHNQPLDYDVSGRIFWLNGVRNRINSREHLFAVIGGLSSSTPITVTGSFFDQFLDDQLINAKFGMYESDPSTVTTLTPPTITAVEAIVESVDIGIAPASLKLTTAGQGSTAIVELKEEGSTVWTNYYTGPLNREVVVSPKPGLYRVRLRGIVQLPDGLTTEVSAWSEWPDVILIENTYNPPTPAVLSIANFRVARIMDGIERYDLKVPWAWSKGTGTYVREFTLFYTTQQDYASSGWTNASKINVGAAQSAVIPSFPFKIPHIFMVRSIAWGPEELKTADSNTVVFSITELTEINNDFTLDTSIEVMYSHIKAFNGKDSTKKQTFMLDAATGSVIIGTLDALGEAPISFDAVRGIANINGGIITKTINAAEFVLTYFDENTRPAFRTTTKTSYGDPSSGIWVGMTAASAFKFDLGDAARYIRWDGTKLEISGDVILKGSEALSISQTIINSITPGFYSQAIAGILAFDPIQAINYFINTFNKTGPAKWDVLTQYDPLIPAIPYSKMWNGTDWVAPALSIHGNILASGTIRGETLVAETVEGNVFKATTSLTVGLGNNVAILHGSNPVYRLAIGNAVMGDAPFRVQQNGKMIATDGEFTGKIYSANYVANTSGYVFNQDGSFELYGGKFRGDLQSNNYSIAGEGAGWKLSANGDFFAANGTFRGTVEANQIIGDIVSAKSVIIPLTTFANENTWYTLSTQTLKANSKFNRSLIINSVRLIAAGYSTGGGGGSGGGGSGTVTVFSSASFRVLVNGVVVHSELVISGTATTSFGLSSPYLIDIPMGGTNSTITIQAAYSYSVVVTGSESSSGAKGSGSAPAQSLPLMVFRNGSDFL